MTGTAADGDWTYQAVNADTMDTASTDSTTPSPAANDPRPNLTGKRWCYTVLETQHTPGKGYTPSIVIADDPGHYPLTGNGPFAEPWYWGLTLDEARTTCAAANLERGRTTDECDAIVVSSMIAGIRANRD